MRACVRAWVLGRWGWANGDWRWTGYGREEGEVGDTSA